MCRLAIIDKKGFESLEKTTLGALGYLDYLEKTNGGHGNGYALIKDGKIVEVEKGLSLDNEYIYNTCRCIDFDYFIYHTRITSQGTTCDNQCHPFVTPKKDFLLCMNGTEREYGNIGKLIGTSDTDAIFRIFYSLDINEESLSKFTSRFIGFRKKKGSKKGYVFFTNSSYMGLQKARLEGMVVGSSFPKDIECDDIETNYYWKQGKKIKLKKIINSYKNFSGRVTVFDDEFSSHKLETFRECNKCGHIQETYQFKCKKCNGNDTKIIYA